MSPKDHCNYAIPSLALILFALAWPCAAQTQAGAAFETLARAHETAAEASETEKKRVWRERAWQAREAMVQLLGSVALGEQVSFAQEWAAFSEGSAVSAKLSEDIHRANLWERAARTYKEAAKALAEAQQRAQEREVAAQRAQAEAQRQAREREAAARRARAAAEAQQQAREREAEARRARAAAEAKRQAREREAAARRARAAAEAQRRVREREAAARRARAAEEAQRRFVMDLKYAPGRFDLNGENVSFPLGIYYSMGMKKKSYSFFWPLTLHYKKNIDNNDNNIREYIIFTGIGARYYIHEFYTSASMGVDFYLYDDINSYNYINMNAFAIELKTGFRINPLEFSIGFRERFYEENAVCTRCNDTSYFLFPSGRGIIVSFGIHYY